MSFTKEQLNRLLDEACDLLMALEDCASAELRTDIDAWFDSPYLGLSNDEQDRLDAFFEEINREDDVDREMKDWQADMQAQDFDTFGKRKI